MDLEIKKFSIAISNHVNASNLPEEVKRMVLKEILANVTKKANEKINEQLLREEEDNAKSV